MMALGTSWIWVAERIQDDPNFETDPKRFGKSKSRRHEAGVRNR